MNHNKDLALLNEYMNIYTQLLPFCFEFGGSRFRKSQIPTFAEYKKKIGTSYDMKKGRAAYAKSFCTIQMATEDVAFFMGAAYKVSNKPTFYISTNQL